MQFTTIGSNKGMDTNLSQPQKNRFLIPLLAISIILILAVGVGIWYAMSQQVQMPGINSDRKNNDTKMDMTVMPDKSTSQEESMTVDEDGTKVFTIEGRNFTYSLKEIRVKKGDKIRIVFKNTGGFHDWVLDEFDASTPQIQDGETTEVEFVADKVGTFVYYCSVGNHRQMGMWGKLIVEE